MTDKDGVSMNSEEMAVVDFFRYVTDAEAVEGNRRLRKAALEARITDHFNKNFLPLLSGGGPLLAPVFDFTDSPMEPQDEARFLAAGLALGAEEGALHTAVALMQELRRAEEGDDGFSG